MLALALVLAACTGSHPAPAPSSFVAGGTLRVGVLTNQSCEFTFCGGQHDDPQWAGEDPMSYEVGRCCLLRTLLSYNGQSTSGGGTILRPDLANGLPAISNDGLTWTFHLRRGLHYAPPLQRTEITAQDFIRSFRRLLGPPPSNAPDYYGGVLDPYMGNYLDLRDLIAGAAEYVDGKASGINGLEAPDPHTLRIHLTRPDGALASLLSEPDTAPIPPNPQDPSAPFGVLQDHSRPGWPYVVASGPYMIEGAGRRDFSKPPEQQLPASGDAPNSLTLVRNPSWDPRTDRLRAAEPGRIVLMPVANDADAENLVKGGTLDLVMNWDAKPNLLGPAAGGAGTRAVTAPRDWMVFVDLNTALPPFNDLHVRRAVNLAIDRRAVVGAYAHDGVGAVPATHIGLDSEENNLLLNYDPLRSVDGNLQAARQEMAASAFDRNRDGTCDAAVCTGIQLLVRDSQPGDGGAARLVSDDLRAIGIGVRVAPQDRDTFNASYGHPEAHIAMRLDAWVKDLTDGATYFPPLFASPATGVTMGYAPPLVGAPPSLLKKWGYAVRSVPNVDDRVEQCLPLAFTAADECWAGLDQYLITNVVARAPLVVLTTGRVVPPRVSSIVFDQSDATPMPALDRVVLKRGPLPSPPTQPSLQAPTIPDGVYRFTIAKADLYRFDPHYDPNGIDENTGTTTVYMRHGWFETVQTADHPVYAPISVGAYTGTADRVVFKGLEPPDNAIGTPPMRWTFDGHALHFTFLGCGNLNHLDPNAPRLCDDIRINYEAHPWEKVG